MMSNIIRREIKKMIRNDEHIKSKFLDWFESRLSEVEMHKIEEHLSECSECKNYFELMQDLTSPSIQKGLNELEPDPFLPTRIKAIVNGEKNEAKSKHVLSFLRLLFFSLASSAAILIGIMLGQGLYNSKQSYQNNQSIVSAYYQVYSQEGLSDNFESTLSTGREIKK